MKPDSSEHTLGDAPIEPKYREEMRQLAQFLHEFLNGPGVPIEKARTAFVLMVMDVGIGPGRCNYVSTVRREDVVVLLREQLARFRGSPDVKGRA